MARSASRRSRAMWRGGTASSGRRHGHDRHDASDRDRRSLGPEPCGRREGHRPGHGDGSRRRFRRRLERACTWARRSLRVGPGAACVMGHHPLYERLVRRLQRRDRPAGLITTALVTVTVTNPVPPPAPVPPALAPSAVAPGLAVAPSAPVLVGAVDKDAPGAPSRLAVVLPRAKQGAAELVPLTLRWVNPKAADLARVVVILNLKHAPRSAKDGSVVYNGLRAPQPCSSCTRARAAMSPCSPTTVPAMSPLRPGARCRSPR